MRCPQRAHSRTLVTPTQGPTALSLYKDYATITWTVNGHLLKNLIDRSTLSTVKNDGPLRSPRSPSTSWRAFPPTTASLSLNARPYRRAGHQGNHRAWFHLQGHLHEQCPVQASRGLVQRGPLPLQAIRACEPKSKHLTCRTATGLG
ncbi:hypothetical protein HPB49_026168 [Dermacentor silvarum]|nr:hypothetical protein HPB49_026168 [Dermacentor silvarum]